MALSHRTAAQTWPWFLKAPWLRDKQKIIFNSMRGILRTLSFYGLGELQHMLCNSAFPTGKFNEKTNCLDLKCDFFELILGFITYLYPDQEVSLDFKAVP